jgi:hypothetical protein
MQEPATDVQAFILSQSDRIALVGLTTHPGFRVLTQQMEAACQRAYARVIQCDPTEADKVLAFQKEARAASAFCDLLRRAINWHVQCENVVNNSRLIAEGMDVRNTSSASNG